MSRVEQVRDKVFEWCSSEGFNPEIIHDTNAKFNIRIEISGLKLQIIQRTSPDSFFVVIKLALTFEQYNRLENLRKNEREEFVWDLNLTLAANPSILEFHVKPDPPNKIRAVMISSKPIFYDGLSKDVLMSRTYDVLKAFTVAGWKINRAIGLRSKSRPLSHMYT